MTQEKTTKKPDRNTSNVRVPNEDIPTLDALKETDGFNSRTDTLSHLIKTAATSINLPKQDIELLDLFADKTVRSRNDAISYLIRKYAKMEMEENGFIPQPKSTANNLETPDNDVSGLAAMM